MKTQAAPASASMPSAEESRRDETVFRFGDRSYRVRGLAKNTAYDVMKVSVLVSSGELLHVDTFNLYSARQRSAFVGQAAVELGIKEEVVKKDLGRLLLELEQLQDVQIRQAMTPKETIVTISDSERDEALELLSDPQLLGRIVDDLEACGLVGEDTNKLTAYLAAVSRKMDRPLAVLVQSSSAAGKSTLLDAVLALVPEEERVSYSAMTGQSLFYMGEADLKHKALAIAEEEGAERASYALKLLQSEGALAIASTGKDPSTGRLVTHSYRVEGPVAIMLTTTAADIDEELLNRCLLLSVDEDRKQTRAIHELQRRSETLDGLRRRTRRDRLRRLHQNAQRLLRPLAVVNPFACQLTFPDSCTRTRRDHEKYLGLIRAVALLRQYQRPVRSETVDGERVEYVEASLDDVAAAGRLAAEVLGRSLDELPPQSRRLLLLTEEMVSAQCRQLDMERPDLLFSRRELREHTGWGDTQIKVHLRRLVDMEYLTIHRATKGCGFAYELLYDGQGKDGRPFLPGLVDAEDLEKLEYDPDRPGQNGSWSAPGRGVVGGRSAPGRDRSSPLAATDESSSTGDPPKNAHQAPAAPAGSYPRTALADGQ